MDIVDDLSGDFLVFVATNDGTDGSLMAHFDDWIEKHGGYAACGGSLELAHRVFLYAIGRCSFEDRWQHLGPGPSGQRFEVFLTPEYGNGVLLAPDQWTRLALRQR